MSVITSAIGKDPDKLELIDTEKVSVITGASQAISGTLAKRYVANKADGVVTFTLPETCPVGLVTEIIGMGAGGWTITQGTGQSINVGASASTPTSGSVSGDQWECVKLICDVANTHWIATSVSGSLTVV